MTNIFNGMFGKVGAGMCRLSINGEIAVKTDNGYKTYNVKKGRLTNCDNFVFDVGEDLFFVMPTTKVKPGDIILVAGKPKCVIETTSKTITVINYEDSTVENMLPERHVFMGNTYYYGKIVSMFGNNFSDKPNGMNKIMSYMMMSELMKGNSSNSMFGSANPAMFMLLAGNGNMTNMFDGMFDFDFEEDATEEEE